MRSELVSPPMLSLLIDALAVSRLTRLVVDDKVAESLRFKVMGRFPQSKVSYLVTCTACTSVWAAFAVLAAGKVPGIRWAVRALALSEMAIVLRKVQDG